MKPLRRSEVYKALNLKSEKIPPEMGMSHLNVTIGARYPQFDGTYQGRVTIYPATGAYAKHRIFVYCPRCGKEVPYGRLAQHDKVHTHEIIVGNIGSVYVGGDSCKAEETYNTYVEQSKKGIGRAGGETVHWFVGDEIYQDYLGDTDGAE